MICYAKFKCNSHPDRDQRFHFHKLEWPEVTGILAADSWQQFGGQEGAWSHTQRRFYSIDHQRFLKMYPWRISLQRMNNAAMNTPYSFDFLKKFVLRLALHEIWMVKLESCLPSMPSFDRGLYGRSGYGYVSSSHFIPKYPKGSVSPRLRWTLLAFPPEAS